MSTIIGWDVGGANVKVTSLSYENGGLSAAHSAMLPFEIWRARERLPEVLVAASAAVTGSPADAMALTMTAELADVFQTKREGVNFVFDSMVTAFPDSHIYVLNLDGVFMPLAKAWQRPLDFAAANWLATALWIARRYPESLLVDIGSTTTDIIPILGGRIATIGRTDLGRLESGELVYTGALRTNVAAIVQAIPVRGSLCPVASEYFAISGDVYLVLGRLDPADYTCATPDGRPATVEMARQRLARLVCADTEDLSDSEIDLLAHVVYQRQVEQIGHALLQVLSRLGGRRDLPVVSLGLGAFLAHEAARRLDLPVLDLAQLWGHDASVAGPSWAAAHLLAEWLPVGLA